VLADIVWVIRKFQPDIIINRFPGDARAGHGNHSASAILSQEAFVAAADPNQFPEQLKQGVHIWQAKRLLWNTFNFGGANTTSENQLKIDAGIYNAMLGKSYGEIGGEARSMHKSQGEGRPRRKGPVFEYFTTLAGDSAKKDLMDGIATDWSRIPKDGMVIQQKIDQMIQNYQFEHPDKSVDALVSLHQFLQGIQYREIWWYKKKQEIEDLIIACSGLFVEATTDVEYAVPGEKLNVGLLVNKRNNINIQLDQILLNTSPDKSFDSSFNLKPLVNTNYSFNKSFTVPAITPVSQPYWLNKPLDGIGNFVIDDQPMVGKAESDPAFSAKFVFSINGIAFMVNRPVQYKYVDPVRGEIYQPLSVIAPVVVSLDKQVLLTNVEQVGNKKLSPTSLLLQYKTNFNASNLPVTIQLKDDHEKVFYSKDSILNVEQGSVYAFPIELKSVLGLVKTKSISAAITYTLNGKTNSFAHFLKTIKYDHIPTINYFYQDKVTVIDQKIITSPKKVAYIIGAGDLVPEALEQLGYPVTYLREWDITDAALAQFNVIVLGIRAFNIHEWLTTKNDVLNRFVNNGGHLVVQYLKSNQVGLKKVKVGPYPFSMSGIRVTEENAKLNFLVPDHAIFNFPNKITNQDFDGWIQERSTYQADPITAPYEALISMNDAGEKPSNGSLITAKYGKGNITYLSLVLFRQLPVGNFGAYKLLANIIGLPASK
jgi:hypothetical protein